MVKLSNIYAKKWLPDTFEAKLTMYKAMNWIPPSLIFNNSKCIPEDFEMSGEKYVLKDKDSMNMHYEVTNGDTK